MIRELNHIGIRIRRVETISFYADILGGKVTDESYIPSSSTKCIHFQLAGGLIEFLQPENPSEDTRFGLDHIAYIVDDLDAAHQRLTSAGYVFSVAPKVAGTGRGRLAFLSDPNGVRVELIHRDVNFRIPKITEGPIRSIDHLSLLANDLEAAEKFYTEFMEMKPLKKMYVAERELTMAYLSCGDDVVELLHRPTPQTGDLIGHIALRVDSVDNTVAYLESKGTVIEAGFPKPAGNGIGRLAVFRDPEGNKIEILDRKDLRDL